MPQKPKRTNRKRLASLSALGAGALGIAAVPANANDIVFSGVINAEVPHPFLKYTLSGPEGAGGVVRTTHISCQFTCGTLFSGGQALSKPGKHGTEFRVLATGPSNTYVQAVPQGAIWGTAAGKSAKSAFLWYIFQDTYVHTKFNATDRYLLFRFQGGALKHDMYGWARITITSDLEMDIVAWAYAPSGVRLPAGYHGTGQQDAEDVGTAQSSAYDATGLPALAIGAPGLRRLRAARAAAAAKAAASMTAH